MPRRDGTGPQGQGNGTGRVMGICRSNASSNPENQMLNNGFGKRNSVKGSGNGKGRGNNGQNRGFSN